MPEYPIRPNSEDSFDPFACSINSAATTPDPATIRFIGQKITYARFFISGCEFRMLDGTYYKVTGLGSNTDPDSIWILINGERVKLTDTS